MAEGLPSAVVQVERAEGLISRLMEGASSEMWISSFLSCLLSGSLFSKYASTRSIFYNGHHDIEIETRMRPLINCLVTVYSD